MFSTNQYVCVRLPVSEYREMNFRRIQRKERVHQAIFILSDVSDDPSSLHGYVRVSRTKFVFHVPKQKRGIMIRFGRNLGFTEPLKLCEEVPGTPLNVAENGAATMWAKKPVDRAISISQSADFEINCNILIHLCCRDHLHKSLLMLARCGQKPKIG